MRLDGDAAFAFEVHGIEQLCRHVTRGDGAGAVQQAVRKRRFPMVNMGDDAKISNVFGVHQFKLSIESILQIYNGAQTYPRKDSGGWL